MENAINNKQFINHDSMLSCRFIVLLAVVEENRGEIDEFL
jgi:hypothetical protein